MNKDEVKQNVGSENNEQDEKVAPNSDAVEKNSKEQQQESKQEEPQKKEKVSQTKKEDTKEDKKNGLSEEEKLLLRTGGGVNLVPKKSKAEVKKEKKKFSFSLSSIVSLMLLVTLSLGVVFFNIISKNQLKSAKEEKYEKEAYLQSYSDKYLSNEEILERIDLYRDVQRGVFSPREVVEYVMAIVERESSIDITSFNLSDALEFQISGGASELENVAKIWYLLGTDENIVTINLSSVGKAETGVSFSFEGELETDKFINK